MVKIVCWNINRGDAAWPRLKRMRNVDVALLQEVRPGAAEQMGGALGGHEHWGKYPEWNKRHGWPAVVNLRPERVKVRWFRPVSLMVREEKKNQIAISDPPTLAAARVTPLSEGKPTGAPFIVVSMYARWYSPHPIARNAPPIKKPGTGRIRIYADASAHRIISDLSGFIAHTNPANHRIIAAGDLNTIYGAKEESTLEMPIRAQTIFDRMAALGMEFVGPRAGDGGKKADPPTADVRPSTCNVPTFLSPQQMENMRANGILSGNQLDYVFASRGFDESVRVHAMNDPKVWGPSDHCRIVIEVG